MKHKLQKVDIDKLQDQRKKKKSKTNSKPPIEIKIKREMDSTLTIKKPE